jgi:hypothetical protein
MLEEVEVPQPLDLGAVDTVFARGLGMAKGAAALEIDDGQLPMPGIEVHSLHKPGAAIPRAATNNSLVLADHLASAPSPSSQSGQAGRRVICRSPACGFVDGGRTNLAQKVLHRTPPTTPQAQQRQ